jgi:hypothetical protein
MVPWGAHLLTRLLTASMLIRAVIAMLPAVGAPTLALAAAPVADATLSNLCRPELWVTALADDLTAGDAKPRVACRIRAGTPG